MIITILLVSFLIISFSIIRAFTKAPVKYVDEERFLEAIRYEERFSNIYENNETPKLKNESSNLQWTEKGEELDPLLISSHH